MKLKSILKTLPLETLESIHRFWEFNDPKDFPGSDKPEARRESLIGFLYPRLQLRHSFQQAFEKLGPEEKDLVYLLAIHGGDLAAAEAARRCLDGDVERLRALVEKTSRKGFVFIDYMEDLQPATEIAGLPEPYLRYVDLPSYWEGYLGYFLKDLSAQRLKTIANQGLGLKLKTSKKHLLIWEIRHALTDPATLRKQVEKLPAEQRAILTALLEKRGVSVYRELLDSPHSHRAVADRSDHVQALTVSSGLIFTAAEGENRQNNLLMIPRDIAYMLRSGFRADERSLRELDTVSASESDTQQLVLDSSGLILRDLVIFAAMIRNRPPRVLAGGGIGRNDLKQALPFLSPRKTLKYVRFLTLFLTRLDYLIASGETWTLAGAFDKWIEDAAAVYRDLYTFWLDTTAWNEEFPEGDTVHAEAPPSNLSPTRELRRLTLRNLETIPHEDWIDFDAFAQSLEAQMEQSMPARSNAADSQPLRHAALTLESIVAEGMYWLGLATLGVSDSSHLPELGSRLNETLDPLRRQGMASSAAARTNPYAFVFKPSALGRQTLANGPEDPERLFGSRGSLRSVFQASAEQFTVQPNNEILAPPDLRLTLLYRLCRFCEPISVDVMTTLAINKATLRTALDSGMNAEEILATLEKGSNIPLPETIRQMVRECGMQHGELRLGYAGGFIQVGERALLEEIKINKNVKDCIKDAVGENTLLLAPGVDVPKLGRDLRKAGFMPQIESDRVSAARDNAFFVRLGSNELGDLLGILKFVVAMEDEIGEKLTGSKAQPILDRLQGNGTAKFNVAEFSDAVGKSFLRKYHAARKKQIDDAAGRYKNQLARLLAAGGSVERRRTFEGPNPAVEPGDIARLIQFAIETETRVEINFRNAKNAFATETVEPEVINDDTLYAFCDERESHGSYALSRIRRVRLL